MPNPKTGTVTMDTAKAVQNVKAGQVEYRVDRQASIHTAIGKVSFTEEQLTENFRALQNAILRAKPASAKGQYIKSCAVAATFWPWDQVGPNRFDGLIFPKLSKLSSSPFGGEFFFVLILP